MLRLTDKRTEHVTVRDRDMAMMRLYFMTTQMGGHSLQPVFGDVVSDTYDRNTVCFRKDGQSRVHCAPGLRRILPGDHDAREIVLHCSLPKSKHRNAGVESGTRRIRQHAGVFLR